MLLVYFVLFSSVNTSTKICLVFNWCHEHVGWSTWAIALWLPSEHLFILATLIVKRLFSFLLHSFALCMHLLRGCWLLTHESLDVCMCQQGGEILTHLAKGEKHLGETFWVVSSQGGDILRPLSCFGISVDIELILSFSWYRICHLVGFELFWLAVLSPLPLLEG